MKDSLQLIKNPLGIFALFVTFIDSIAGLVISVNFSNLKGCAERLPLIWFIVIFPILVLGVFVLLVIKYNEKLYAPKDFDNQEGFLIANGKIIKPNEEPKTLEKPEKIPLVNNNTWSMLAFSDSNLSKNMQLQIQEAALQRYSSDRNLEILSEVKVSRNLTCDGITEKNGEIFLFEVKANYHPGMRNTLNRCIARLSNVLQRAHYKAKHIVLILVTKDEMKKEEISALQENLNYGDSDLIIINYKNDDLLKKSKNSVLST